MLFSRNNSHIFFLPNGFPEFKQALPQTTIVVAEIDIASFSDFRGLKGLPHVGNLKLIDFLHHVPHSLALGSSVELLHLHLLGLPRVTLALQEEEREEGMFLHIFEVPLCNRAKLLQGSEFIFDVLLSFSELLTFCQFLEHLLARNTQESLESH